jgi:hypothetical protein
MARDGVLLESPLYYASFPARPRLSQSQLRSIQTTGLLEGPSGSKWQVNRWLIEGQHRTIDRLWAHITVLVFIGLVWPRKCMGSVESGLVSMVKGVYLVLASLVGVWQMNRRYDDNQVATMMVRDSAAFVCGCLDSDTSGDPALGDVFVIRETGDRINLTRLVPELADQAGSAAEAAVMFWREEWERECRSLREAVAELPVEEQDRSLARTRLEALLERARAAPGPWPSFGADLAGAVELAWRWREVCLASEAAEAAFWRDWEARIRRAHPVRSRCPEWLALQRAPEERRRRGRLGEGKEWGELCGAAASLPFAWPVQKALEHHLRGSAARREEFTNLAEARHVHQWRREIWRHTRWRVYERLVPSEAAADVLSYEVVREDVFIVATSSLLWRWKAAGVRAYVWASNTCNLVLVDFLWKGPLSLQALLRNRPFFPFWTVDAATGQLVRDARYPIHTLASRVRSVAYDIADSRRRFEGLPDTGLLPRAVTRVADLAWNYGAKGLFVVLLVFLQPALTVATLSLSLAVSLLALPLSALGALGMLLVWDPLVRDTLMAGERCSLPRHLVVDLLGLGLLRALAALLLAAGCALGAALLLPAALLLFAARRACDTVVFHALIRTWARVPVADSLVARRVDVGTLLEGPSTVVAVGPAVALVAVRARLEVELLAHYEALAREALGADCAVWDGLLAEVTGGAPPGEIRVGQAERARLLLRKEREAAALADWLVQRHTHLQRWMAATVANDGSRLIYRQTAADQALCVPELLALVASFFEEHIFPAVAERARLTARIAQAIRGSAAAAAAPGAAVAPAGGQVDEVAATGLELSRFWRDRDLREGDMQGLAREIIEDSLGQAFLARPLEDQHLDGSSGSVIVLEDNPDLDAVAQTIREAAGLAGGPAAVPGPARPSLSLDLGSSTEEHVLLLSSRTKRGPMDDPDKPLPGGRLEALMEVSATVPAVLTSLFLPDLMGQYFPPSGAQAAAALGPIRPFDDRLGALDARLRKYRRKFPSEPPAISPSMPPRNFLYLLPEPSSRSPSSAWSVVSDETRK